MLTAKRSRIKALAVRTLTTLVLLFALAFDTRTAAAINFSQPVAFSIPPQPLSTALVRFSDQAGVQFTAPAISLGQFMTQGVQGKYAPTAALRILLRHTGLIYRIVDARTVGISSPLPNASAGTSPTPGDSARKEGKAASSGRFRVAQGAPELSEGASTVTSTITDNTTMSEVVVTARKITESALDVPESITALSEQTLQNLNIQTFDDYATKVPNLGFSYGTAGLGFANSRTIAIRGISGEGTTALYIDDTPVFDTMDPRVVDIQRIEVLKGPQGTLFGEGSLGGAVRLITNQPVMDKYSVDYTTEIGATSGGGSPDGGMTAIINAGLVPDTVAARAVVFYSHTPGFVTRVFPDDASATGSESIGDQGARTDYGGSLTVLFKVADNFDVTARILTQITHYVGLPVAYAPLPAFEVVSLIQDRTENVQEGAGDEWYLPSIQLNYNGSGFDVVSSTTYFSRRTDDIENGTEGTYYAAQSYFGFNGTPQPDPWYQDEPDHRFTQETRLSFDKIHGVSGTAGVYYSHTAQVIVGLPNYLPGLAASGLYPTNLDWASYSQTITSEKALFGELYVDLPYKFNLTLGARQYWLNQEVSQTANGLLNGGLTSFDGSNAESGVSPKAALSYKIQDNTSAYVSAAKGFRQGGAGYVLPEICASGLAAIGLTPESASKYNPDTVWDYEVGAKSEVLDRRLLVTGALFQEDWQDIQQLLFISSCDFGFTGNAGSARSRGAELEADGQLLPSLTIHAGVGYDDARITSAGASGEAVGSRVREMPALTATVGFEYERSLTSNVDGFVSGDSSYVGNSLSSVSDASTVLVRPAYDLVNANLGVRWGANELSLFFKNLTNAKPNLGDLGAISFNRYVPNAEGVETLLPRVATELPFTFGIQYHSSF